MAVLLELSLLGTVAITRNGAEVGGQIPTKSRALLCYLAVTGRPHSREKLAGFTLQDSPAFDEWQFFQSQGLCADLASALEWLARAHGGQGEYQPAIAYARRWLALDPFHEPAHRCLMDLYAR